MRTLAMFFCLVLAALLPGPAAAQNWDREAIESYDTRVEVLADGSMTVTETITVIALGQDIRRGIYRDFPTLYKDAEGNTVRVPFDIVSVERDGKSEPWHTEGRSNGVRLYIGDKNVFVDHGRHVYKITYKTDDQIGFFSDHDELYWNVTGTGWTFPILEASAVVVLPPGAEVQELDGWTGPQGAKNGDPGVKDLVAKQVRGTYLFRTTRPLNSYEGLTILVAFSKGAVAEPTAMDKAMRKASGLANLIWALGALGLGLAYFLWAWNRVGRDPAKGPIVPLFGPPEGVSPAAARFIMRMGFDNKAFSAAVLSCAVKGALVIEEPKRRRYELSRGDLGAALSREERLLCDKLFAGRERIELKQTNHATLRAALNGLKQSLRGRYQVGHFSRNTGWFAPGALITLAGLAALALLGPRSDDDKMLSAMMTVMAVGWGILVAFLWQNLLTAVRESKGLFALGIMSVVTLGFTFGLGALLLAVWETLGVQGILVIVAFALLDWTFLKLLRAPTPQGREVMDQLEGFRLYLGVAEKDRMNFFHSLDAEPPQETPELFERFLPYALALDVEQQWSERFATILERAMADTSQGYHPVWYQGVYGHHGLTSGLAAGLGGSLAGAIASSSRAPGSSSGSGGGGFSGGGGGGGGGGGW